MLTVLEFVLKTKLFKDSSKILLITQMHLICSLQRNDQLTTASLSHRPCAANILFKILLTGASRVESFLLYFLSQLLAAHHGNSRLDSMHNKD